MNTGRIQKLTLSIGEVVRRTGLSASDPPFYEDKELIVSARTPGNQTRFTGDAIRRMSFIRAAWWVGLPLEENRAALVDLPAGRTPTREAWEELAWRWKPWIDERIAALEQLRDQLASGIECGCQSPDKCTLYNPLMRPALLRSAIPVGRFAGGSLDRSVMSSEPEGRGSFSATGVANSGTGGVRTLRVAASGRGKRGGEGLVGSPVTTGYRSIRCSPMPILSGPA